MGPINSTNAAVPENLFELTIDHIDPLGQGVAKVLSDNVPEIYFIPKTLPGEVVLTKVEKKTNNLNFSWPQKIIKKSERRISPNCQHFDTCNGCHFLHTDYASELEFKKNSFLGEFKRQMKWDLSEKVSSIGAPTRVQYRNRMQLHYTLNNKPQLGLKFKNSLTAVPHCLLPNSTISRKMQQLFLDDHWLTLLPPGSPRNGHLELETVGGHCRIRWNRPYADEGFTQVNSVMNQKLVDQVKLMSQSCFPKTPEKQKIVVDLFCGNGNLSKELQSEFTVIGSDFKAVHDQKLERFHEFNLFHPKAVEKFLTVFPETKNYGGILIIDPPRSGFKNIADWTSELRPQYLIAVSCHYSTLIRDLKNLKLKEEQVQSIVLVDMFPGTYHIECVALIKL
ncbi:MAG: hypothetical protein QE271_05670 [Bacteriovoracaceae bacterium]|nr:hypothetical protein [Bacteriovoracaceae bacterium]